MKIQIDTNKKTIQVLGNVKLDELIELLKSMLGESYKEYLLINEQISYPYQPWINPIILPYYVPYTPTNPWPTITCNTGTYNLELQENTSIS